VSTQDLAAGESLASKLNQETAKIAWGALAPSFAQGRMICVSAEHDLIKVASAIAEDNADAVRKLQATGGLFQPTDAHAKCWHETEAVLWAVVINPWVVVQEPS